MSQQIELPKEGKNFSKTGITAAIISATGGFDIVANTVIPLIRNTDTKLNWISIIAFMGGALAAIFRKFSDGKIPKIV